MTVISTPPNRTIGEYIRAARKSTGLSQTDFAAELAGGVTQTRVSRWESGKDYPNILEMKRIAEVSGHEYLLDLRDLPSAWERVPAGAAA
jgi:transcriptional regulator with XRE-family HTH domain